MTSDADNVCSQIADGNDGAAVGGQLDNSEMSVNIDLFTTDSYTTPYQPDSSPALTKGTSLYVKVNHSGITTRHPLLLHSRSRRFTVSGFCHPSVSSVKFETYSELLR